MYCLKCGTEIESPNVFCESCLKEMAKYPVSRETPIVIHPRPEQEQDHRNRRPPKPQKPEEIIAQLRRRQRRLTRTCVLLGVACVTLILLFLFLPRSQQTRPAIGQNYVSNITETTQSSTGPSR